MKSFVFSLSGVFVCVLGIYLSLLPLLPDSVVQAAERKLPFSIEFVEMEETFEKEGLLANGRFVSVLLRIRNETAEARAFPMTAIIVTDGQAETVALHQQLHANLNEQVGRLHFAPAESRLVAFHFDIPSHILRPRLELEAVAFASPFRGSGLARRVLTADLAP